MVHEYFVDILSKYSKTSNHQMLVDSMKSELETIIRPWAGECFNGIKISGSFAKSTETKLTKDADFLVSSTFTTKQTPKEIYNMLFEKLKVHYSNPVKQNVSIGISKNKFNIDVVPAKNQQIGDDHWLYSRKKDRLLRTNINKHIAYVKASGRTHDIKILKIWSNLHNLEFPSFYLELTTIDALRNVSTSDLDLKFQAVLKYLSEEFPNRRVVDPANTNNIISDELTDNEKRLIASKAREGLDATNWGTIIW